MQSTLEQRKSLGWSIRAPNREKRKILDDFCRAVKEDGLDICRVTIGFAEAYLAARNGGKEAAQLYGVKQNVTINMANTFTYQISKPRREPYSLSCVKKEFQRTFSSVLFEAYVLQKARGLNREFCFRDFLELKHDAFRRIVQRLRRKGKIIANPQRTIPRWYFLAEKLSEYQYNTL